MQVAYERGERRLISSQRIVQDIVLLPLEIVPDDRRAGVAASVAWREVSGRLREPIARVVIAASYRGRGSGEGSHYIFC